ncbi:hypothetical protein [Luteimonas sp. FCS-9]|uniref:hypothetical protein n=1 Tax=Luteimonas sp. FCS-9 TaxID=1547516 RepID=UPI00063E936E|nr:hypothetical protein [Luteimonas sp. FCS-9]KLJ01004.1 hypothetical protein WQ56_07110 [Luteimonas sp. FCS-9]
MNDFDDLMQAAWQEERPDGDGAMLAARVRRHRWRHRLRRGVEIALTLIAVVLLGRLLTGDDATPAHWLVLPFFAVYLPAVWCLLLRAPRPQSIDATQDVRTYAHVRLSQLRTALRDLWLARIAALGLSVYAAVAATAALASGDAAWQIPAGQLLAWAGVWTLATFWLSHRQRGRRLQEYRAMRRLTGGHD